MTEMTTTATTTTPKLCTACGGRPRCPAGRARYRGLCRECSRGRDAAERHAAAYHSEAGGGTSRVCPGHDRRMALYSRRAALGLPLFAPITPEEEATLAAAGTDRPHHD